MKNLFPFLFVLIGSFAQAQVNLPRESQRVEITQRIGITDISVTYHSPAVKGRKIFGGIVPYNEIWRAGANENTVIGFTTEVSIEGQKIPAGKYGLHMIPSENEWTIILSKNHKAWGSYFYKQEEDQARFTVKPRDHSFTEWLNYSFEEKGNNWGLLSLNWDKLSIPFKIEVDVQNTVMVSLRETLNKPSLRWQDYYNGANYCLENKLNLQEALRWANTADSLKPNHYDVLKLKADLQEINGDKSGAAATIAKANELANEEQLNAYGYDLLKKGQNKEALKVFQKNVSKHPDSWNVYDSLAEAQLAAGDKKNAKKNYKLALAKAPEEAKKRIEGIIATL